MNLWGPVPKERGGANDLPWYKTPTARNSWLWQRRCGERGGGGSALSCGAGKRGGAREIRAASQGWCDDNLCNCRNSIADFEYGRTLMLLSHRPRAWMTRKPAARE